VGGGEATAHKNPPFFPHPLRTGDESGNASPINSIQTLRKLTSLERFRRKEGRVWWRERQHRRWLPQLRRRTPGEGQPPVVREQGSRMAELEARVRALEAGKGRASSPRGGLLPGLGLLLVGLGLVWARRRGGV